MVVLGKELVFGYCENFKLRDKNGEVNNYAKTNINCWS